MRNQWCSDAANQPQRCRIQRRAAECAQCSRQQCSCVDLASGFVRISIAGRKCTNANVRARLLSEAARCSSRVWQRQQSNQRLLKIKAEARVGSLGGMHRGPTRVWAGFMGASKNPHENSRGSLRLFQSFGGLYFPQDHSQRRTETFSIALVIKIVTASRTRWCCEGIVDVRSSACTVYFERTLRRCARCCKNSATRAQLGPPNWISA